MKYISELEELKNEISYMPLVRIVESLQAAVEKIPIKDAFDELDSEREYYREKRKESNERLISKKGMIGKAIGFAPMICLFVGYLILPLCVIGLGSMSGAFSGMQTTHVSKSAPPTYIVLSRMPQRASTPSGTPRTKTETLSYSIV